jgi:hypothetical protein
MNLPYDSDGLRKGLAGIAKAVGIER